ncbi:hypothetical protein T492DRAFT_883269, partial [Pavlovales sp. CCMP2436]
MLTNQLARADGCGCECTPGWRGQMCNSCAADSACLGLAHGDQMPASDAQGEEEELVCRQGDFSFYPGTYLK